MINVSIIGKRNQCDTNNHEYQRKTCQQDSQGNFIRRFLSAGTFYEGNHLIKKTLTRLLSHQYFNVIREYFRSARHRAFVSSGFSDNGS